MFGTSFVLCHRCNYIYVHTAGVTYYFDAGCCTRQRTRRRRHTDDCLLQVRMHCGSTENACSTYDVARWCVLVLFCCSCAAAVCCCTLVLLFFKIRHACCIVSDVLKGKYTNVDIFPFFLSSSAGSFGIHLAFGLLELPLERRLLQVLASESCCVLSCELLYCTMFEDVVVDHLLP